MWEALWIALPVFALIILIGFFTDLKLPGNIPVGLAALLVGTAIGWIGGVHVRARRRRRGQGRRDRAADVRLRPARSTGSRDVAPLLATAIPLGIYNFTEGMTNVESAAVAGDSYNLRSDPARPTAPARSSARRSASPFPPAVYIGHPGWKAAGGRTGYSLATGVVIALMCFLGCSRCSARCSAAGDRADPALHRPLIGAQAFQDVARGARGGGGRWRSSRTSRRGRPA